MPTNVYVDGFNLYYGCLRGSAYKWLDLAALCRIMLPHDDIKRIRYFTARVSGRPPDREQPQRQDTYFRALRTIPEVSIHLGHFLTHETWMPLAHPGPGGRTTVLVQKTEEKGSDVNLATYLLLDAAKGDCDTAVVISNDSDLKEPIALAQSELGVPVGVLNPHPAKRRSRAIEPTFFKQIREPALRASQFSERLTDAQGSFQRPSGW